MTFAKWVIHTLVILWTIDTKYEVDVIIQGQPAKDKPRLQIFSMT